ncbi:hypothetical protein MLD38_025759 [Melastoma candidum]|uniref:Uncharacterized protein n=1 Tax=Melastoma candidum TaxID=119954 RepID=A0ACB9NY73_9MYRT|nr:hypothetical protein MLD38_025759 [Melastoma candidum]
MANRPTLPLSNPETTASRVERSPVHPPPTMSMPPRMGSPLIRTPGGQTPPNGVSPSSNTPQMSTPPGPPVFTSPVRAAAVPFRSSPSTLQPVAFSAAPTLPTASPHFSNGSAELQHQISDAMEELMPRGKTPYALFSANKVLKQKKLANLPSFTFGALVSPGREISSGSGQWQCVICGKLNSSGGEYISPSKEDLRNFPELASTLVDYVQTGNKRLGFVPVSDSRMSGPIILVIDECLDEPHLQHLQGSLHAFVDSLSPTTRIGIVLYGRTVSVYDFSEESVASADVLPGGKSPTQESLKGLIYGTGIYLAPMHASLPVAQAIFSSLRPYKLNIPEVSRDRCLGAAVEVAMAIVQGPSAEVSRGVVKRTGGRLQNGWTTSVGKLTGTIPWWTFSVPELVLEAFGVNLQRAATRAVGSHGLLEIRCSDDILVAQVVGPGEEAQVESSESFKNDAALSIQMLSVEETQSFSISMENKGDIKSDHVYFQFVIQFSNVYQADVSRVITVRLPAVDSVSDYLESVQDEAAAVLISKRTLLRAKGHSDAIDMRATIDERIKDIALHHGAPVPKSKLFKFPKEISLLPELLFHLRRGPLLGSIVGHEDERSVLRNLFLNASFDLSLRMVAPRCLMHREGGTFEELPAYDLAMQSDMAVVLDHGTDVFIWLGAELAANEGRSAATLAACRTLAEELTESRFPASRILAFKEGSSQARYFVSRLIPAHKDPPYEQEARFPQLRNLTAEQRAKLKSSFIHFDDPSFCEWMRSLKVVPPDPN